MRTLNPLLLSVGIHLSLAALMIGALSAVHKIVPTEPKKISLKVLMRSSTSEIAVPAPQPMDKPIQSIPKPVQPVNPVKKTPIEQNKPFTTAPQPIIPIFTATPVPSRAAEAVPVSAVKASPAPIPKQQENYEEENLGRIRSILMEKLIYPKNALRLKQQGEATVTFTLETDREVNQITVTKSSGFELLDDAAKNLILSSANEFPKPSKSVRISIPIAYKLR